MQSHQLSLAGKRDNFNQDDLMSVAEQIRDFVVTKLNISLKKPYHQFPVGKILLKSTEFPPRGTKVSGIHSHYPGSV